MSYATFINWAINKKYTCVHCLHTQGLLLPQLLDGHVFLAVLLHHLVTRTGQSIKRQFEGFDLTVWNHWLDMWLNKSVMQTFATAISKSSWVTWTLRSLRAYMPASVQTPCKQPRHSWVCWLNSLLFKLWKRLTDLHFSTRSSRHQLCNLPQVNATSEIHFPGVDLQNIQTSL